jgi:hypothetical protein
MGYVAAKMVSENLTCVQSEGIQLRAQYEVTQAAVIVAANARPFGNVVLTLSDVYIVLVCSTQLMRKACLNNHYVSGFGKCE